MSGSNISDFSSAVIEEVSPVRQSKSAKGSYFKFSIRVDQRSVKGTCFKVSEYQNFCNAASTGNLVDFGQATNVEHLEVPATSNLVYSNEKRNADCSSRSENDVQQVAVAKGVSGSFTGYRSLEHFLDIYLGKIAVGVLVSVRAKYLSDEKPEVFNGTQITVHRFEDNLEVELFVKKWGQTQQLHRCLPYTVKGKIQAFKQSVFLTVSIIVFCLIGKTFSRVHCFYCLKILDFVLYINCFRLSALQFFEEILKESIN